MDGRGVVIRGAAVPVLVLGLALGPALPAAGQAVCTAPHSAGGVASGGGGATLAPGAGWLQLSTLRQASDGFFGPDGDTRPLLADGEVVTYSVYATAAIGLLPGLSLWAQLPVHSLRFEDLGGSAESTGVGDVRAAVRIGGDLFGVTGVPVLLRAGMKVPGQSFPVDATVIPLTEGQVDWELSVEYTRDLVRASPLAPAALYGQVWLGYRWRTTNEDAARTPGNEMFARLAAGGLLDPIRWQIALQTLEGEAPTQQGFRLDGAARRLWVISPSILLDVGPGRLGLGGQLPVAGRNLPTGPAFDVGYLLQWSGVR